MNKDLEIARGVKLENIKTVAKELGLHEDDLEMYGKYKAKLPLTLIDEEKIKKSKLVLVTAITPTPAGEGKTTISIGLTQGLNKINKKTTVALREPSLGPVFGMKGGAAGGGHSQVVPMEDINLHFTGDLSAIEKAHNLLSALLDNAIQKKDSKLNIDPRSITWKRVMDMNDRALRDVVIGLGGEVHGVPRETGFNITAASEVMAILCLAEDIHDLKARLGSILLGFTYDNCPIYAKDIKANGAMAALLKDAIMPNLVQTLEGTPAIIHGGPFANIAQGTNSVIATKVAMSLSDYTITEAGFASDLGAEKFFNIKCRNANLKPNASVVVATIRALKYHGGVKVADLGVENLEALEAGIPNLDKHIDIIKQFSLTPIVAINKFVNDTDAEIELVKEHCAKQGVVVSVAEAWAKGGDGCVDLAEQVVKVCEQESNFSTLYDLDLTTVEKIEKIATKIYGASKVEFSAKAKKVLKQIDELEIGNLPICMAKTQKSLSDTPSKKGRPSGFTVKINNIEIAVGAGFIIPIAGAIMRMPGLPSIPAAESIDIDNDGNIQGLF